MIVKTYILKIEFGKSSSKLYQSAFKLASILPNFCFKNNIVECGACTLKEYLIYHVDFESLILIIQKWKLSNIFFYGKKYEKINDLWEFRQKVSSEAGKYSVLLNYSDIAMNSITLEDLPFPIVYYPSLYGTFFAFSEDINEKIYFCECERIAIENYIKLTKQMPLGHWEQRNSPLGKDCFPEIVSEISLRNPDNPLSLFGFKKDLCFFCNHKIPHLKYCDSMYGSKFQQKYSWYINQEYFKLGIDLQQIFENNILANKCPLDIQKLISHCISLKSMLANTSDNEKIEEELKIYEKQVHTLVENSARKRLGFKNKGESWTNETTLYYIVKGIFPNCNVIFHYRPKWLNGLELDIYIKEEKIAFEYQGIQHFFPIKFWGGETQLKIQQEHDMEKRKLCQEYGIRLLYFNYNESITEAAVRQKLQY